MAARRNVRSLSVPIVLGTVTVVLSVTLLVGWSVILGTRIANDADIAVEVWLLVLGAISFVVIIVVLVLLSIFLAREILEVRRQDSFIDSVTHELKSPLASLKLCLETMGRPGLGEAQRDKLHTMMRDDVGRLSSFIDDVLQASRLAHDNPTMNHVDVPLAGAAREAIEMIRTRHQLDGSHFTVEIPDELMLTTDSAALSIVLRNLVDNGVKYSPSDRVAIEVAAKSDGKWVSLEVRDRGIGIAPSQIGRVFDRFYRVEHEDVRKRRGTGLGLFVVHALVRNMGGRIEARSEGLGHGTTMVMTLPLSPKGVARGPRRKRQT